MVMYIPNGACLCGEECVVMGHGKKTSTVDDDNEVVAECCGCCSGLAPQRRKIVPRFASEFDARTRKRFLFRLYLGVEMTLVVWLMLVQWATSDHLSPATWLEVDEDDEVRMARDNSDSLLPRLAGHPIVLIVSAATLGLVLVVVTCAPYMAAWVPLNFVLWILFSLSSGYLLSSVASNYSRAMVVHSILLMLLIVGTLTLYCALPYGDYWHAVAVIWLLMLVLVVGMVVILPRSDEYMADWTWLNHKRIWQAPRHLYSAAQVWATLAFVVVIGLYFIYSARFTERHLEPEDWLAGSILLSMYLWLVFALSIQLVTSACQTSTACCLRRCKG
jgi:FtsH-binding integral membrane protein